MDLFNKSGVLISSVLVLVGSLIACQAQEGAVPAPTVIEDLATQMGPQSRAVTERRLQEWADLGSPVAQRELALRYLAQPDKRKEAIALFERAANAGDAQAAVGLVSMARDAGELNTASAVSAARSAGRVIKEATSGAYAPH